MSDRYGQLCALADYDPAKIKSLESATIMDYYLILNSRIQAVKKSKK